MFKRPSKSYLLHDAEEQQLESLADAAIEREEAGDEEDKSARHSIGGRLGSSRRRGRWSNPDLLSLGSSSGNSTRKQAAQAPFRRTQTDEAARRARRRRSSNQNLNLNNGMGLKRNSSNPDSITRVMGLKRNSSNPDSITRVMGLKRNSSNPDSLSRVRGLVKRTTSHSSERSQHSPNHTRGRANAVFEPTASRRRSSSKSGRGSLMKQLSNNSLAGLLSRSSSMSMDSSHLNGSSNSINSSSINKMANDVLRTTVRAPVTLAKAVVDAGTMASDAALSAGTMASDAALSAGSSVVYGGKSVVKAGKRASAKSLSFGAGIIKSSMSVLTYNSLYSKPKKSSWEEAIEAMDEILDPDCPAFQHMTAEQVEKMQGVRKLLIKGTTERNASKLQHVPAELIFMQDEMSYGCDNTTVSASLQFNNDFSADNTMKSAAASSHFILEEYAGMMQSNRRMSMSTALQQLREEQEEDGAPTPTPPAPQRTTTDSPTASLTDASLLSEDNTENSTADLEQAQHIQDDQPKVEGPFVPPEFAAMDKEVQMSVLDKIRWDALNGWDFDVFELDELTNGHAMLFVGWSIIGAPYAQETMAKHVGVETKPYSEGYSFIDELKMPPNKLYNFIKAVEQDYNACNPYHNAVHGADALQSLHTLIQQSAKLEFMEKCPKLYIFAILLSALVHDVGHFGTTNAFHSNIQSELTVLYNDKSVMESWHVAQAFSIMLDLDLSTMYKRPAKDVTFSKFQQSRNSKCNVLCNATPEQFQTIRRLMIDAILHTDMTNHFAMVNAARAMLMEPCADDSSDGISEDSTWQLLMFMLHMADISGQAKADPLFHKWRDLCFEEFFAQGDQEAALGLPISPNCDRKTLSLPNSQIGFIKFVVQPAFEVLGEFIPFVHETIVPIIHNNMMHYVEWHDKTVIKNEKASKLAKLCEEQNSAKESKKDDLDQSEESNFGDTTDDCDSDDDSDTDSGDDTDGYDSAVENDYSVVTDTSRTAGEDTEAVRTKQ